ncbi:MAG: hypothetical protein IZT55_02620 [Anaerolineae bacterium]|nr:hypothetical protein [Anaerolineae bacterium]
MKTWELMSNDPGSYTIASDARCSPTSFTNDQIWELSLDGGDPAAISVQTTYGLRVRNFRIFPRFIEGDTALINPTDFSKEPIVEKVYPNFIVVKLEPFDGLIVSIEYWVPNSQVIAARTRIVNERLSERNICLEWSLKLTPSGDEQAVFPLEMHSSTILCLPVTGLSPIFFQSGGAKFGSGPFPSLAVDFNLPAGGERSYIWSLASKETTENSFEEARKIVSLDWDAKIARLDILNQGLISIETGIPEWDAAFALAQKSAFSLLTGPNEKLDHPSFALSRHPDHGFSTSADGAGYPQAWRGQTALEAFFLSGFLLPSHPDLIQGFLTNFLTSQTENGFVDWRPSLGGQQSGILATPILAHLTWETFKVTNNLVFLKNIFPKLIKFINIWFTPPFDFDGDGLPEWSHSLQAGFDEHPLFSAWSADVQNVDIQISESPVLCSFIYNEIQALSSMAQILNQQQDINHLLKFSSKLHKAVEQSWNKEFASYQYWDRDTHNSHPGDLLGKRQGPGEINIERTFKSSIRLVITIKGIRKTPRQAEISIHGVKLSGKHCIERVPKDQYQWQQLVCSVTSRHTYLELDIININNIDDTDFVQVQIVNYQHLDITLLLPLWAKIPDQERATELLINTIRNPKNFWQPFGLPFSPKYHTQYPDSPLARVSILWNNIVGEGLLSYGFQKESAELITHLMKAVVHNLIEHKCFMSRHNAQSGQGAGDRHAIQCLAPLSLFLKTLGVIPYSPNKVALYGNHPFPWPVTIRYRGLTIVKDHHKTKVTFSGGQTVIIKGPKSQIVALNE